MGVFSFKYLGGAKREVLEIFVARSEVFGGGLKYFPRFFFRVI
jgi:hypothetical protein